MKQFLLLLAVIAVIFAAVVCSLYVLDLIKLVDLRNDLKKVFGMLGVAAVAGILIMGMMRAAQK